MAGTTRIVAATVNLNLAVSQNKGEAGWWVRVGGSTYRVRQNRETGKWRAVMWTTVPRPDIDREQETMEDAIAACLEHYAGPLGKCEVKVAP